MRLIFRQRSGQLCCCRWGDRLLSDCLLAYYNAKCPVCKVFIIDDFSGENSWKSIKRKNSASEGAIFRDFADRHNVVPDPENGFGAGVSEKVQKRLDKPENI